MDESQSNAAVVEELKPTARLENWIKSGWYHNSIEGNIHDDTKYRFADGTWVHTSAIKEVRGDLLITANSVYKLGKPFQKDPNARPLTEDQIKLLMSSII